MAMPNFGLYSYARCLFVKTPISGMATSAARVRRVRTGQFIYSTLFAWEGAFGLVTPEFDGWFVSNEYPTFTCDESQLLHAVDRKTQSLNQTLRRRSRSVWICACWQIPVIRELS